MSSQCAPSASSTPNCVLESQQPEKPGTQTKESPKNSPVSPAHPYHCHRNPEVKAPQAILEEATGCNKQALLPSPDKGTSAEPHRAPQTPSLPSGKGAPFPPHMSKGTWLSPHLPVTRQHHFISPPQPPVPSGVRGGLIKHKI